MLLVIFSFLFSSSLYAASCCSGGVSTTSLITNNDKAQFTTSVLYSSVYAQVKANGKWQKLDGDKTKEIFTLEGATILSDRTQMGVSVPFQRNTYESQAENIDGSGVGDVRLNFGYEAVPDWDYSRYRPKVYVFGQLQMPTGRSIYETQSTEAVDATGSGLWGLGAGTTALKTIRKWDLTGTLFAQKPFAETFNGVRIEPGNIYQASLGVGYNYKDFRVGITNLAHFQESGTTSGVVSSEISLERYVSSTLNVSYLIEEDLSVTASYSDQTIFGKPVNSQLSRGVFVSLQKRWLR